MPPISDTPSAFAFRLSRRRALAAFGLVGVEALAVAFGSAPRIALAAPPPAGQTPPSGPPQFVAWHGKTLAEHISARDSAASQGFRFISLSVYGATASPYYAAVMIKPPAPVTQHDYAAMSAEQWQQTFDAEGAQGYGPIILTATGSASSPLFAAVFEPQNPLPLTRHGLTLPAKGVDPNNTIQGMNAQARSQGLILRWAASYGDASSPAFAGIWVPNTATAIWNNDDGMYKVNGIDSGLLDSSATYQARFDAETSAWCRPRFVTLNTDAQYFSVFVDAQLTGAWYARHGLSPAEYQTEFDTQTQKGFFPVCVQAAGPDQNSAKFAAIFVTSRDRLAKSFNKTGPVAHTDIDAVVEPLMQSYAVRHAALAIVHGTRLVYARGYTHAEPGWPLAQPTTCFRLASVSKTPTAVAIYQLIEAGALQLGTRVNDVLGLRTPAGGPPTDARFNTITIQHLLEHTSGLNPGGGGGFDDGLAIQTAFFVANWPVLHPLPVTAEMTDSYIASLQLQTDPGATQNYNNCGYYLLARVVAKLRDQARPIDAFQQHLFDPLGITRIRRGVSLLAEQPADEARYQDYDLLTAQSQMSQDQPLVPDMYGSDQLEILEGSGGLTGAATDVARLIAMFNSEKDTPALKRKTLTSMLTAGAQLQQTHSGWRAGYGLDSAVDVGQGRFYGQKGGLLDSSSSVLQFDGEWGFTMLWGGGRPGQLPNQPWYPDFPAVMDIAKGAKWGPKDLFPDFGMPTL